MACQRATARDVVRESAEPVTLVTLAPLTNIALLLRTYPDVAGNLRDLRRASATAVYTSA